MAFAVYFRIASEKEKTEAVARLVKSSTGDFDFYLFAILGISMAALGLVLNSPEVIIGSMLIAPVLYPLLSLSLSLVLSDFQLLFRSVRTLVISFAISIAISYVVSFLLNFFGDIQLNTQLLARAEPSALYFMVAFVSGFAATYAMVHANLNEMLPGVAISVALVPPLAAVGIGFALHDMHLALGAIALFVLNVAGIALASMVAFTLMSLHGTHKVVTSAIHQEEKRIEDEQEKIAQLNDVESQ
jgi:uncharacterized hydrophobic protein (TIGR00271 family)